MSMAWAWERTLGGQGAPCEGTCRCARVEGCARHSFTQVGHAQKPACEPETWPLMHTPACRYPAHVLVPPPCTCTSACTSGVCTLYTAPAPADTEGWHLCRGLRGCRCPTGPRAHCVWGQGSEACSFHACGGQFRHRPTGHLPSPTLRGGA